MTSVQDVAELAGVSPATVSRVLSNSSHPVRDATRARVLAAVKELDFRPNLIARGLVTSRTHTLAAIVHDISDPYFGEIARGLEDRAREAGFRVYACSSDRDAERELAYVELLIDHQVDGLVFAGGGIEDEGYARRIQPLLATFAERGGVIVALGPSTYPATVRVKPDNEGGAAAMTRHLLDLGHERVAFISGPEHVRTSDIRLRGYRGALEAAGIEPDPELILPGGFTISGGEKAATELLRRQDGTTAIFAANDLMACGALRALASEGINVPDEVSVAGYDDIQMAAYLRPPLTTVRMDMYRMGTEAARVATERLAGESADDVELPTEIVVRESTARSPS